jgi:hypothetical protein
MAQVARLAAADSPCEPLDGEDRDIDMPAK